jgi:hypothetical protein
MPFNPTPGAKWFDIDSSLRSKRSARVTTHQAKMLLSKSEQRINAFVNRVDNDLLHVDKGHPGKRSYVPFGIDAGSLDEYAQLLRNDDWRRKINIYRLPDFLYRFIPVASFVVHF